MIMPLRMIRVECMEYITSAKNPLIARIRRLGSERKARRGEGLFLCEGPKMLTEALRWETVVDTVVCAEGVVLPNLPQSVRVVQVPEGLLRAVALTEAPQGLVFLCKGKPLSLPEKLEGDRWLVLDGLQDPGNVGTVWRTADAFGASGLLLCNSCDPWNPKVVRATMGAIFRLPVYEGGMEEIAALVKEAGLPLYATALRDDTVDVADLDLKRCAAIIGSEGRGVSEQALELCQATVKIPMRDRCESLNAAVAAAVVLWEGWRN